MYHGISPFLMMAFLFAMVIGISILIQAIDTRLRRSSEKIQEDVLDYSYDDLLDNLSGVYYSSKFENLLIQHEDFILNHVMSLMHQPGFEGLDAKRVYVSHLLGCKHSALSEICLHEVEQQAIDRLCKLPNYLKAYK